MHKVKERDQQFKIAIKQKMIPTPKPKELTGIQLMNKYGKLGNEYNLMFEEAEKKQNG